MASSANVEAPLERLVDCASHASVKATLRRAIVEDVDPLLRQCTSVALLEFPPHSNVGDSAIWLGTVRYLRDRHRLTPVYTNDIYSYSREPLNAIGKGATLLISGGGNLGDTWEAGLESKIRVLDDFPDVPIIQLPQTIHFQRPESLDAYRRAVARHRHFTLLVRDRESFELAQATFDCPTRLCPDMAFWLDVRRTPPAHDLVLLLRTDQESGDSGMRRGLPPDLEVVDWLDEPAHWSVAAERWLTSAISRRPRRLAFLNPRLTDLRNRAALWRVRRGCAMLSAGKVVVTDRLHGHILCVLLGIPHVLLDNSYGKLRRFHDSWTSACPDAHFAGSIGEALEIARGLIAGR